MHNSSSPYNRGSRVPRSVYRHSFDFESGGVSKYLEPGLRHQREPSYNPITHENGSKQFGEPSHFQARPW